MPIEPWMLRAALVIGALCTATGALLILNVWLERRSSAQQQGTGRTAGTPVLAGFSSARHHH